MKKAHIFYANIRFKANFAQTSHVTWCVLIIYGVFTNLWFALIVWIRLSRGFGLYRYIGLLVLLRLISYRWSIYKVCIYWIGNLILNFEIRQLIYKQGTKTTRTQFFVLFHKSRINSAVRCFFFNLKAIVCREPNPLKSMQQQNVV